MDMPYYADMLIERSRFVFECPFCGRTWESAGGRQTGFLKASAKSHVQSCGERTPEERSKKNRECLRSDTKERMDRKYQTVTVPATDVEPKQ